MATARTTTTVESKSEDFPRVNTIWIGEPTEVNVSQPHVHTGHDTIGVDLLINSNKENPFTFWCLKEHHEYYKKHFQKHINDNRLQVRCIEDALAGWVTHPSTGLLMQHVKRVIELSLNKESKHGSTREKAFVKDLFALALLVQEGGWIVDTNVVPAPGKKAYFPKLESFAMPFIQYASSKKTDLWMMYSPCDNNSVAATYLKRSLDLWYNGLGGDIEKSAQLLFADKPASLEYYRRLGGIMLHPIGREVLPTPVDCESRLDGWDLDLGCDWNNNTDTQLAAHGLDWCIDSPGVVEVSGMNLTKVYFNTHHHHDDEQQGNGSARDIPTICKVARTGNLAYLKAVIEKDKNLKVADIKQAATIARVFKYDDCALELQTLLRSKCAALTGGAESKGVISSSTATTTSARINTETTSSSSSSSSMAGHGVFCASIPPSAAGNKKRKNFS